MLDPAIQNFLQERKAARIKTKTTARMSEEAKLQVKTMANEAFDIETWLPNAAKRAKQLAMVSHLSKFSHPSAKTSAIIALCEYKKDGFVRTGNVDTELDVSGNAAALDVYKFLSLSMHNDKTILENLEQNTPEIVAQFSLKTMSFEEIRSGLLAIKNNNITTPVTSDKVKQVYFPIEDDYHLLSILTPSGLMFKFKERINAIRFSEQAKKARDAKRNNSLDDQGFSELYNLSVIGFGGTKPQNISLLNSQNFGQSYLLECLPPTFKQRRTILPKHNFFTNTLNPWKYKDSFQTFHRLICIDYNSVNIRRGRDNIIHFIISQVIECMWSIRQFTPDWSKDETFSHLPRYQKHWLDNRYIKVREADDDLLDKITHELAHWFLASYEKILRNKAKKIGAEHLAQLKQIIDENKEGLR